MALIFVATMPPDEEEEAAWNWLSGAGLGPVRRVSAAALGSEALPGDVVWWHATEPPAGRTEIGGVRRWLEGGGRLWLTLQASALLPELGLETRLPDRLGVFEWRHAATELTALEGERRGLIGFGPHPVFAGLHGGLFLVAPRPGRRYPEAVYTDRTEGRMVAAEWQYLSMDPSRRMMLEYAPGVGRVLTTGAHLLFAGCANPYRPFLERFAQNCLAYLSAPAAADDCYWPAVDLVAPPSGGATGGVRRHQEQPTTTSEGVPEPGRLSLRSSGHGDAQFDVIGRRIAILGRERTGVTEVWSLPVRLARNVRATIEGAGDVSEFRVTPDGVERVMQVPGASIVQTIQRGSVQYDVTSGALDRLEIEMDVDLRWAWPYPEGVLGVPGLREEQGELMLLDGAGVARGAVRFVPAADHVAVVPAGRELRLKAVFAEPRRVRVSVRGLWHSGGEDGEEESLLSVETPDAAFNNQLAWVLNGLRAFDVESPAGRGLVAGWAETGSGWWSGRLGYAWYFGRDSMWSAVGCLGAGLGEAVRESLRLMARYQRLDGKMLHELTPNGVVHFDAADSTPLFLWGLERYVRWTGDTELAVELRANAVKALEFCQSTDADHDGLIENTGVGHGWAEGGRMHGAHATFYLNACWAGALESMAYLADLANDHDLSSRCRRQSHQVKALLNGRLYRRRARWFAHGIDRQGELMTAQTMEPAVAALLGLLDPERTGHFLDALASPRFTTPWGVRYVAADDPDYNPRGYHSGTVWPLFTGWAAAAEYACGRPEAALAHLRSSLALVQRRSLGAVDEVLNGDQDRAEGVCPHQLWSHAVTVMALVEGLLGIRPDAVERRLTLQPQMPPEWKWLEVRGLRVGQDSLSFRYERRRRGVVLEADGDNSLKVTFLARGQA